jgi:hypothetical protein
MQVPWPPGLLQDNSSSYGQAPSSEAPWPATSSGSGEGQAAAPLLPPPPPPQQQQQSFASGLLLGKLSRRGPKSECVRAARVFCVPRRCS